jgi:hypothetical protein
VCKKWVEKMGGIHATPAPKIMFNEPDWFELQMIGFYLQEVETPGFIYKR